MITVIIADDQMLIREGLKTILELEEDIKVVALAKNGEEAVFLGEKYKPTLMLLDIQMPVMDGIHAMKILRKSCPDTGILILSTFLEERYVVESLATGACGYLLKDMETDKMIQAIRDAAVGQLVLPATVAAKLASNLLKQSSQQYHIGNQVQFTEREKEIALLLKEGLSNREIAEKIYISEGTVRNYISSIYSKLEVQNRISAIGMLKGLL